MLRWWQIPYFYVGTKAYDFVAGSQNLESSYFMTRSKALSSFPMLKDDGLKGSVVYYDGSHNDSRMNTSIALTAAQYGATILNHIEVLELKKDRDTGKLIGAVARDHEGGMYAEKIQIDAKVCNYVPFKL